MKQFNLEEWLQDKSRKVVTRDGREVRILCWDAENSKPIVALVSTRSIARRQFDELTINYFNDGTYYGGAQEDFLDLFFADEDNTELTEFEKELKAMIQDIERGDFTDESFDFWKGRLLDLARKELEENYYTNVLDDRIVFKSDLHDRDLQGAYDMGKEDSLKDLPKWKKLSKLVCFERTNSRYFAFIGNDTSKPVICCNGYYISLADLETLPKEE